MLDLLREGDMEVRECRLGPGKGWAEDRQKTEANSGEQPLHLKFQAPDREPCRDPRMQLGESPIKGAQRRGRTTMNP